MYVTHNITQTYPIHRITNESLTITKNYIINIANRLLKHAPLITAMVQFGIIFSLGNSVEAAVLREETSVTTIPELDEVVSVPINSIPSNNNIFCGGFAPFC